MKKKNKAANGKRNEPGPKMRTYAVVVAFGLFIVAGFFFAARQHFSAMDYGMKNSRLRRQVDDLESEKRRLMLARETSLSPLELLKAAKRSGIAVPATTTVEAMPVAAATKDKGKPAVTSTSTATAKPPIAVKAAAISPAPRVVAATESRPERERVVKLEKKPVAAE